MNASRWIVPALAALCLPGLTIGAQQKPASILSVRALPETDGAAIEVISSQPLSPAISKVENPSRLVIDLPNGVIAADKRSVSFHSDQINGIRVNQFKVNPPMARIVVDLAKPAAYSWDASGNLLTVRIREVATGSASNRAPAAAIPVGAHWPGIQLAGNRVPAGSSVTAGFDAAVLHLPRGGDVRVCPGTTVSVSSSQNGSSFMLGMSTGALETHYSLDASSDSILTPDFRLLLTGPGEFDYGINVDSHGNTCVQALPGNTASVIVSELMGDGTYQVKPTQQVMFQSGRLNASDKVPAGGCGCPPDLPQIKLASSPSATAGRAALNAAELPTSKPGDPHVQVEVPFVFRAVDKTVSAPIDEVRLLPIREVPSSAYIQTRGLPPPRRGLFGKLKGFFSSIFG